MNQDALICPACGCILAAVRDGKLQTEAPLYEDGDCLDWFGEEVALPKPPLFCSVQYLKGHCHSCSHGFYWLEIAFAVLPFEDMCWVEADGYIAGLSWVCSDYRLELVEGSPWGSLSARMSVGDQMGHHHLIGPFSIAATALASPDGYGLYRLVRGILSEQWDVLLRRAYNLTKASHMG
jgi:hypothetical protein